MSAVVQVSPSAQSASTEQLIAQSIAQVTLSSPPSQVPSPQHSPVPDVVEQVKPPALQRESEQSVSLPQQ